jgi:hypothetical protein
MLLSRQKKSRAQDKLVFKKFKKITEILQSDVTQYQWCTSLTIREFFFFKNISHEYICEQKIQTFLRLFCSPSTSNSQSKHKYKSAPSGAD